MLQYVSHFCFSRPFFLFPLNADRPARPVYCVVLNSEFNSVWCDSVRTPLSEPTHPNLHCCVIQMCDSLRTIQMCDSIRTPLSELHNLSPIQILVAKICPTDGQKITTMNFSNQKFTSFKFWASPFLDNCREHSVRTQRGSKIGLRCIQRGLFCQSVRTQIERVAPPEKASVKQNTLGIVVSP
jgi:hypothetical protein